MVSVSAAEFNAAELMAWLEARHSAGEQHHANKRVTARTEYPSCVMPTGARAV
jgi:hypothetical protein